MFRWLRQLFRSLVWFIQRGRTGLADEDWWDLDRHVSQILIRGLRKLRDEGHGVPTIKRYSEETWKAKLTVWIEALEGFLNDDTSWNQEAMADLFDHWGTFWD